jgi:hypothetical protein
MATSCTNPAYRRQEQIADTNCRRSRQTNPQEIRAQENERNAQTMVTSRTNPAYRTRQEQIADTNHRRSTRHTNPAYRRQEQITDTNRRRSTRQTNPSAYRRQKQIADTN